MKQTAPMANGTKYQLRMRCGQTVPTPVRLTKRGGYVAVDDPLAGYHHEEPVFDTAEDAWAEQARRESKCQHRWVIYSHEERGCSLCGAVEFMPDLP